MVPVLITQPWDPHSWSKGVPAAMSMHGGTSRSRGPNPVHHYKVGLVVKEPRASKGGLTANFGTVISMKGTLGFDSTWSTDRSRELCGLV